MSAPASEFERRHVVSVEDHLYHTTELLETIHRAAPALLPWMTCCAIDAPGADTTAAVDEWLRRFPGVQVAACVDPAQLPSQVRPRFLQVQALQLQELASFARLVAALLKPGGILLQDVHLSTLRFVAPDRWWESIYAAATVRGTFARHPPAVRFLSNKRGYSATFGRDLLDAGFDPRDVLDKSELEPVVVPSLVREVDRRFPLELLTSRHPHPVPASGDESARREVESELDLLLWDLAGRSELGGRLVEGPIVAVRSGSQEARTWRQLIEDRLEDGDGLSTGEVGQRLAEPGAGRAEMSNLAARHLHSLRARLLNNSAILTANHAYRLDPGLVVGLVRPRVR